MSWKKKTFLGGWVLTAAKVLSRDKSVGEKNLPSRFEDWLYKECKIKKETIYNYRNLYKLMSIAPKLMNCRVNMTCFVKNHENLLNYFEENEEQIPWKQRLLCMRRLYLILFWRISDIVLTYGITYSCSFIYSRPPMKFFKPRSHYGTKLPLLFKYLQSPFEMEFLYWTEISLWD